MIITTVKTSRVSPLAPPKLLDLLDECLPPLKNGSVVVVTSKIVSICQGRVVPDTPNSKDELIKQESAYYLPRHTNPYDTTISITRNMLISAGGIDESNAEGFHILLPRNAYATSEQLRQHLCKRNKIKNLGVIISDSTSRPFQRGTTGVSIGYSGFKPLKDYRGEQDIFGRKFGFQQSNIVNGLAAAAVLTMGEGNEQTPIAIIQDVPFVEFVQRPPTQTELDELIIKFDEDIYSSMFKNAPWQRGELKG